MEAALEEQKESPVGMTLELLVEDLFKIVLNFFKTNSCGVNDRISASCENVSSATLKSWRRDNIVHETFLYVKKEKHSDEMIW